MITDINSEDRLAVGSLYRRKLIGMEFSIASYLQKGTTASVASQLYGIDLIGSAIGALLVTAILIPLLGIIQVSFVIGVLSFVSAIIALFTRKKYTIGEMADFKSVPYIRA